MRHGHHNGFEKLRSKIAERGAVRNTGVGRKKFQPVALLGKKLRGGSSK